MSEVDGSLEDPCVVRSSVDSELKAVPLDSANIDPVQAIDKACTLITSAEKTGDCSETTNIIEKEHSISITSNTENNTKEEQNRGEKVAIFWHEECFLHKIVDHPEQPDRVAVILSKLREHYPDDCFHEAPLVTDQQILLFHTTNHLAFLQRLFVASESALKAMKTEEIIQPIDSDTVVMNRTRRAAFRAAGSTVAAVDAVYLSHNDIRYAT